MPAGEGAHAAFTQRLHAAESSPRSKWSPTIASTSITSDTAFPTKLFSPSIAHVTCVPAGTGTNVNVAALVAAIGSKNSSLIATRRGGSERSIVIRPLPISWFPLHA